MRKLKLDEVAKQAGVSVATVDRVLNRRSGVRPETADRVNEVIRRLDYQPDSLTARIARNRGKRFIFVLPSGSNMFFKAIEREIGFASERLASSGVGIEIRRIDVFDGHRLAEALDCIDDDCDGVATVALDHPAVRESIDTLVGRGVHVVTLVSDLPGSRRARYVGIDNHAAGRTAASLVGRFTPQGGKVGLIAGSLALRDHAERKFGFEQVIAEEYPGLEVLPAVEGYDEDEQSRTAVERLLKDTDRLVALYNVGAGNGGIVEGLQALSGQLTFVAHELSPITRSGLIKGTVDAVINQDSAHEVRSALRVLEALCDGQNIVESQERIRIDIFLRDNLPPKA